MTFSSVVICGVVVFGPKLPPIGTNDTQDDLRAVEGGFGQVRRTRNGIRILSRSRPCRAARGDGQEQESNGARRDAGRASASPARRRCGPGRPAALRGPRRPSRAGGGGGGGGGVGDAAEQTARSRRPSRRQGERGRHSTRGTRTARPRARAASRAPPSQRQARTTGATHPAALRHKRRPIRLHRANPSPAFLRNAAFRASQGRGQHSIEPAAVQTRFTHFPAPPAAPSASLRSGSSSYWKRLRPQRTEGPGPKARLIVHAGGTPASVRTRRSQDGGSGVTARSGACAGPLRAGRPRPSGRAAPRTTTGVWFRRCRVRLSARHAEAVVAMLATAGIGAICRSSTTGLP